MPKYPKDTDIIHFELEYLAIQMYQEQTELRNEELFIGAQQVANDVEMATLQHAFTNEQEGKKITNGLVSHLPLKSERILNGINAEDNIQSCQQYVMEENVTENKQEWLNYERNLNFLENKPAPIYEGQNYHCGNLGSSNSSSFNILQCDVNIYGNENNSLPSTSQKFEPSNCNDGNENDRESLHTPELLPNSTTSSAPGASGLNFPVTSPSTSTLQNDGVSFTHQSSNVPNYFMITSNPSTSAQANNSSNSFNLPASPLFRPFSVNSFSTNSVDRCQSADSFVNETETLPQNSLFDEHLPHIPSPSTEEFNTFDDSSIPNVAQNEIIYSSASPIPSPECNWTNSPLDLTEKSDHVVDEQPSTSSGSKSLNWKKRRLYTDINPSSPEIEEIANIKRSSTRKRTLNTSAEEIVIDSDSDSSIIVLNNVPSSKKKRKMTPRTVSVSTQTEFKAWECPVCFYPSNGQEVVTTPCGHVFCKKCISEYMEEWYKVCPSCRTDLEGKTLITLFNM